MFAINAPIMQQRNVNYQRRAEPDQPSLRPSWQGSPLNVAPAAGWHSIEPSACEELPHSMKTFEEALAAATAKQSLAPEAVKSLNLDGACRAAHAEVSAAPQCPGIATVAPPPPPLSQRQLAVPGATAAAAASWRCLPPRCAAKQLKRVRQKSRGLEVHLQQAWEHQQLFADTCAPPSCCTCCCNLHSAPLLPSAGPGGLHIA